MSIYINNTLTNRKEKFIPVKKKHVGMYVCGPTVYDVPHIGHIRSAVIFEVIRRYLKFKGFKVTFIKNITDIDDKIIKVAKESNDIKDIKSKTKEISEKYEKIYHEHMKLAGIEPADIEPKATHHINDIIDTIKKIIKSGYAYESQGNVYFKVKKLSDYGNLSKQDMDKVGQQRRLHVQEGKEDSLDFALWKSSKEGEPSWKSPWGKGRPGWHIECTAMSIKYLGKEFDMHCGGIDLVFPHHENEIAQAKAIKSNFAKYWLHNGLLTIDGEKMSKSLGNYITLTDILKRNTMDALNIFFLSVHYSHPINFTWNRLKQAEKSAEKIRILNKNIDYLLDNVKTSKKNISNIAAKKYKEKINKIFLEFQKALDDDFNTALGLSKVFDLVNTINKFISEKIQLNKNDSSLIIESKDKLQKMLDILCINSQTKFQKISGDSEENLLNLLIDIRNEIRKKGLFELSDEIRCKLEKIGVQLEDTPEGTKYRMIRK